MFIMWDCLGEEDPAKGRLSPEEYERFIKSMQVMRGLNMSAFTDDLTIPELGLLCIAEDYISKNGSAVSVAEAACRLDVSVPAVSRTLKSLERKKLIERRVDERDRRSAKLIVTDEGREAMLRNLRHGLEMLNRVLDRFSDDELSAMVDFHSRISRALADEAGGRTKR